MWAPITALLLAAALAGGLHTGRYRRATDQPRLDLRWWWIAPVATTAGAVGLTEAGSNTPLTDLTYLVGGVAIAVIDFDVHRLPDRFLVTWGALTGFILAAELLVDWDDAAPALFRAACGAGALAVLYLLFAIVASMGLGDVKLAALTGAVLGAHSWQSIYSGTLAAFAVSAGIALLLLLTRRGNRRDHLAFGPAIVVGAVLALVISGSL